MDDYLNYEEVDNTNSIATIARAEGIELDKIDNTVILFDFGVIVTFLCVLIYIISSNRKFKKEEKKREEEREKHKKEMEERLKKLNIV